MYLKTLALKNFRSFLSGTVELQKDLTVFVGENNGGKSNAIDAIRLITAPLNGRRDLYCEATDVRFQSTDTDFELEARFADLSTAQQGRFISAATDTTLTEACFGLHFDASKYGSRPTIWAGEKGRPPEPGAQDMIRHVYLPALRDAKRALASGNPTRIMTLLNHFLGGTSSEQLALELRRSQPHEVLKKIDGAVGKGLEALTAGVRRQSASLGFATDEKLVDIARDLRFKLADHGVDPEDLRYSGHGYANLLYMAIIAVELEKVKTADLTIFLVEEPEAHLHPQLQAAVLEFLRDQAEQSRPKTQTPQNYGPAGELQVIVATHSPNLSAWVSSDKLVVFKSTTVPPPSVPESTTSAAVDPVGADVAVIENAVMASHTTEIQSAAEALSTPITAAALRRTTSCIPLSKIALNDKERRKVDRYVDVTKAAFLFGGRVLLLEGISEALLLPVIAKHITLKGQIEKLRLLRSAVSVPIDGVDFEPYVKLLLTSQNGARIAERVVVVTDGDKGSGDDEEPKSETETEGSASAASKPTQSAETEKVIPGERRKSSLEALAKTLNASNSLGVVTNTYSLEAEIMEVGNTAIMLKAYLELHPQSQSKWDAAVSGSGDERAKKIKKLFKETRKGDFAQILARLIEEGDKFEVPLYLSKAIEEAVLE